MMRDVSQSHVQVGSSIPGRVRLHLREATAREPHAIAALLADAPGIRGVQVKALTGSVLVHYDATRIDEAAVLALLLGREHAAPRPVDSVARPVMDLSGGDRSHYRRTLAAPPATRVRDPLTEPIQIAPSVNATSAPPGRLVDLLIKGTSAILGLMLADSPLGMILGGLDALCLIADVVMDSGRPPTQYGDVIRLPRPFGPSTRCACSCHRDGAQEIAARSTPYCG